MTDLDEPIHVSGYDPAWPEIFEAEARRIETALRQAIQIEHIGSTSVPGLVAKPIIDIMVGVVADPDYKHLLESVRTRIDMLGYEDMGEAGVSGRIYLRRRLGKDSRLAGFNIALVAHGGPTWKSNLALRNYLRTNPDAAREYTEIKRAAVANGATWLLAYSDFKRDCVNRLMDRAVSSGM